MGIFNGWRKPKSVMQKPTVHQVVDTTIEPVNVPVIRKNGTISVLANQITVTDPDADGAFATLVIPEKECLQVSIDGTPAIGQVIVNSQQTIEVSLQERVYRRTFEADISEDEMQVTLKVFVEPSVQYTIKDETPTIKACLELVETRIDPPPCPREEILNFLSKEGLSGVVDDEAIDELSFATSSAERVVLRGIPPKACIPAVYEPVPLPELVDELHRFMKVPSVQMGVTVANFRARIPGSPGKTVRGEDVVISEADVLPEIGNGVIDLNGRLIAARNGRLEFSATRIDVIGLLEVNHDITPQDGLIEFDGDVYVRGSVMDGGFIKSSGRVVVEGNVFGSKVIAEHGICTTGAVTKSTLLAGQTQRLYSRIHPLLRNMLSQMEQFLSDYDVIFTRAQQNFSTRHKIHLIPQALLEQKHKPLADAIQEFSTGFEPLQFIDGKYRYLSRTIRSKWSGIQQTNITRSDIETLNALLMEYSQFVEMSSAIRPAIIRIASASSCSIQATGNILVVGQGGVYSSNLESDRSVLVKSSARGCFIVAKRSAFIHELGSEASAESNVKVSSKDGRLVIRVRHPNTLIHLGSYRNRSDELQHNTDLKGEYAHDHSNGYSRRLA